MPVLKEPYYRFQGDYYGSTLLPSKYKVKDIGVASTGVLKSSPRKISIEISHGKIFFYSDGGGLLESHKVQNIVNISTLGVKRKGLMVCVIKEVTNNFQESVYVHVLELDDQAKVSEFHSSVAEQKRKSSITNSDEEIGNMSHLYEVLYLGKMKVSHKKAPPSFIDDAVKKILAKKVPAVSEMIPENNNNINNMAEVDPLAAAVNVKILPSKPRLTSQMSMEPQSITAMPTKLQKTMSLSDVVQIHQNRNTEDMNNSKSGSANKTMLLHIASKELRLLSLESKKKFWSKQFREISFCSIGIESRLNFGFICKETEEKRGYYGYIFQCSQESIAEDIMQGMTSAFHSYASSNTEDSRKEHGEQRCGQCPMVWFSRLEAEIQGLSKVKTQSILLRKLDELGEEGRNILEKMQGAETTEIEEQNNILVMLVRANCEVRQVNHVHHGPTILDHSDHQQQENVVSEAARKARRSIAGLTGIMKRQSSISDLLSSEISLPIWDRERSHSGESDVTKQAMTIPSNGHTETDRHVKFDTAEPEPSGRRRAKTLSTSCGESLKKELKYKKMTRLKAAPLYEEDESPLSKPISPQVTIFKKTASATAPSPHQNLKTSRQYIFNTVTTPVKKAETFCNKKKDYRSLWQSAINQQILLNRMEKQNKKMQEEREVLQLKRQKLEYEELAPLTESVVENVERLLKKGKLSMEEVRSQLRSGVPKLKRGEFWTCIMENKFNISDSSRKVANCDRYRDLKAKLTPHQHSILIDIGRTFPSYGFYSRPLGPGQLAMYNVLKAYSLLDPEVGYCQGLPFLVGILLLHLDCEEGVFNMLQYLMFHLDLRTMFTPDMLGLQICLYQLTRLLLETEPDIYQHFDTLSFDPSLYGTPWFLTLFAASFPIGFVARVLDLVFLEGKQAVIKIGACLLSHFTDKLTAFTNVEDLINFIKTDIPESKEEVLESIIQRAAQMTNVDSRLQVFKVEYTVIQEELSLNGGASNTDLLNENKMLKKENDDLKSYINSLEEKMDTMRKQMEDMQNKLDKSDLQESPSVESRAEQLEREALLAAKRKLSLG